MKRKLFIPLCSKDLLYQPQKLKNKICEIGISFVFIEGVILRPIYERRPANCRWQGFLFTVIVLSLRKSVNKQSNKIVIQSNIQKHNYAHFIPLIVLLKIKFLLKFISYLKLS
jgi:hypothetical protein